MSDYTLPRSRQIVWDRAHPTLKIEIPGEITHCMWFYPKALIKYCVTVLLLNSQSPRTVPGIAGTFG